MLVIRTPRFGSCQSSFAPHGPSSGYAPDRSEQCASVPARDSALQGLAGSSVADRFRSWQGVSGSRYVFSVFAVDPWDTLIDRLPAGGGAVVIAVRCGEGRSRTALWVGQTGTVSEAFLLAPRVRALAGTACELHLHLLGSHAEERSAIVRDLESGF